MGVEAVNPRGETLNPTCVDDWFVMDARLRTAEASSFVQHALASLAELDLRAIPPPAGPALERTTELLTEAVRPLAEARQWLERTG